MSFSPDRVRVRGRSPAFSTLAANFENPSARNLSTPPPVVRKVYPRSLSPDSAKLASKSAAISKSAALNTSFEQPPPARQVIMPRSVKALECECSGEGFHSCFRSVKILQWRLLHFSVFISRRRQGGISYRNMVWEEECGGGKNYCYFTGGQDG